MNIIVNVRPFCNNQYNKRITRNYFLIETYMLNRVLLDRDPTCYHEDGKIDFRNYFIVPFIIIIMHLDIFLAI